MSDIVSIEVLFDSETESAVRAEWDRLAEAGLSSLASHRAPSNRPHLTLLVRPSLPEVAFAEAVSRLPLPVTLGSPIVFAHGERAVLARQVVPDAALLALHASVHREAPEGPDAAHTAPGAWTPHVTLARRLPLDVLPQALRLLDREHAGEAVALRRWDAASATVTPLG
ncbi:2'-5' RNA ligase family protein [Microbacterium sp. HJ5]